MIDPALLVRLANEATERFSIKSEIFDLRTSQIVKPIHWCAASFGGRHMCRCAQRPNGLAALEEARIVEGN